MRRQTADLMLLTTTLLWALNFTVSKYILNEGLQPLAYSALRYGGASLVFIALAIWWERSVRIARRDARLVGLATVLLVTNQLSFVYALRWTTAATTALIFGTLPIFTALIARLLGVERLNVRFWTGAGLSFAGVALVAGGSGGGLSGDLKGDLLAVWGAITWGGYSVAIAPLMRRYTPVRLSAVMLSVTTVALFGLGADQLGRQHFDFGALVWIGFTFAVLGPLVITNVLWFTAIDRVGPSHAAVFANLQPFLAAIIALVLLSEHIGALQIVGGLSIAGGIVLARRRAARGATQEELGPAERDTFATDGRPTRRTFRGTLAAGRRLGAPTRRR